MTAVATSDEFRLTFEVSRKNWQLGEAVDGQVTFEVVGASEAVVSGAGGGYGTGFIKFRFEQAEGFSIDPTWPLDCQDYTIRADEPLRSPIRKNGTFVRGEPGWEFRYNFLKDPVVHLTIGSWTIAAVAWFYDGTGCEGPSHRLIATVQLEVTQ